MACERTRPRHLAKCGRDRLPVKPRCWAHTLRWGTDSGRRESNDAGPTLPWCHRDNAVRITGGGDLDSNRRQNDIISYRQLQPSAGLRDVEVALSVRKSPRQGVLVGRVSTEDKCAPYRRSGVRIDHPAMDFRAFRYCLRQAATARDCEYEAGNIRTEASPIARQNAFEIPDLARGLLRGLRVPACKIMSYSAGIIAVLSNHRG
jgi:hypothetical protein